MKNTRKSLMTSVVALLLCFSMLLGTTWAWFTDTAVSKSNIVQSGNLDAEMYWSDTLLAADSNAWKNADGVPIFTYDNWEPGYTDVKYVKVKNAGNLAFQWRLSIEAQGRVTDLADVIDVYYINPVTATVTSLSDKTTVGVLSNVINTKKYTNGVLLPAGEVSTEYASGETILAIAFHMQEEAGNHYKGKSIGDGFSVRLIATQFSYEKDSFDNNNYDKAPEWPDNVIVGGNSASATVVPTNDNKVSSAVSLLSSNGVISAEVPAGVKLNSGVTKLTLSVNDVANSQANVTLNENEASLSIDVHISGVAEDNDVVMAIGIKELLPVGLNMGNYRFYHVEDGQTVEMTLLADGAVAVHNNYEYDPATGDVVLYLKSFSEFALVAEPAKWEGSRDYSWYDASKTELTIANADQLAGLSAIVGGMAKKGSDNIIYTSMGVDESATTIQDSFSGKTITLVADISICDTNEYYDDASENGIVFYPIGYWNSEEKYERYDNVEDRTALESGFYTFEGTFDGNGHTISDWYQNTWEMKGDHNWYNNVTEQYYRDGMGLFGRVYKGTVKNLTVKNFTSDGEITTTGSIAAYADGATFENIAIFNCNPRVYNIGNGGIVGCIGWYAKEAGLTTTFKNITVDNSNKISALWGSYDVACGGIVGQYYPTSGQSSAGTPKNGGIHFENCHVSAQMDVYNDVCANYQYYAYRYTGMLIGSVRENVTIEGHVYPKMDGITAEECTVHFGTWNDYYYCEIIDNTTASYTHDYQMSRLTEIKAIDGTTITYLDGTTGTVPASGRANYVIVDYSKGHGTENATCYHFKDGAVWTHDMGGIQTGVDENGDGQDDLKEDKQHIYLEFNNLVTGYGWGVTTKVVGELEGVTILDREVADSVDKFKPVIDNNKEFATESTVTISDLFAAIENAGVDIKSDNVQVTVSPFGATSTAGGTYVANTTDWTQGTLTFSGVGQAVITITDYYFCKTTTVTVSIVGAEKFDTNFVNYKDYLYRVGNANESTVALGTIFKHSGKGTIHSANVDVTITTVAGNASGTFTADTSDWTKGTIQFTGTGVVKVTIKDDTSKDFVLNLEVVDAKNYPTAYNNNEGNSLNATSNNVVLLNDCGLSSLTVSGRYTFYGNGFTATYTGNGQYLGKGSGFKFGVINVSEYGMLDNLRVKCSVYPIAALYSDQIKDYYETDGSKTRYFYQLSAVAVSGNATISNCYIYGGRNNVYVGSGNVTVEDSVLESGAVANIQIVSSDEYTVTLKNVTTIQQQVKPTTYANDSLKNNVMLGFGVVIGDGDGDTETTNPTVVLEGYFKQYNWVSANDKNAVTDTYAGAAINAALSNDTYKHTINGQTVANMGIVVLKNQEINLVNNTGLPYTPGTIQIMTVTGKVYSLSNATEGQIYFDSEAADRTTVNSLYKPQFKYDDDLGGQYIAKTDDGDEFLYNEGDTIKVMFPSGDTKEIDLAAFVNIVKYSGQTLNLVVTCKDENGNTVTVTDGKIALSVAGTYTVTYSVTDTMFFDKDGKAVNNSISYSWDVTLEVALKETGIPNAYFEFDSSKQVIYRSGNSNIVQFIPFLAGLKIYDYNGQTAYLRFDGDNDFNKIAKASINNVNTTGEGQGYHIVTIEFTDGGKLVIDMDVRADSGSSTHSGSIKVRNNVIYVVNGGTTSGKGQTWKIYSYKFVGNNGTEINSGAITFGTAGVDCNTATKPSSNFGTTVKYTVTYNANGGNCGQTTGYATSVATAVTLPTPTRSGYIFAGWYTAASGGTRVGGAGDSYTPSANITLYAQWGKPCDVTYNANGGSCGTASERYNGTALTLPTPTRDGYWFIGWYDAAEGGNKIGDAGAKYNPTGEITLYAHWQEAIKYTVTYNANGGSCGTASATYEGTALTLPTPTRTGYTFNGWYTAASGGTKIEGTTYTPSANITLYAQWKINSYTITVTTNNATVKVNGTAVSNNGTVSIQYGAQVTVEVTYSESKEQSTTIKGTDGTTYTSPFTMPAQNVTINATSTGCVAPDTLITLADGTQVRVDSLTGDELLLVWNLETGKLDYAPIMFVDSDPTAEYEVVKLIFSDGTEVKVIYEHGFWDYDLNKYVYLDANAADYIGHTFAKQNGDVLEKVQLVDVVIETEVTTAWSPVTVGHLCYFVNGMLSMPGGVGGLFNIFEVDPETMTYDYEQIEKDIETYGLYTYEELNAICPLSEDMFNAAGGAYLKISIGKGNLTIDELIDMITRYSKYI